MNFAFSTNAFKQTSLEESLREIAECGYAGVEILADVPHAYPRDMDARRIERVRALLEQLRLTVTNLNAFTLPPGAYATVVLAEITKSPD